MPKQTIGDFLATLRRAKGYTQQEVADKLSVSNRTISAWERGSALPDILLLPAIAELYEVTTDEILSGERSTGERLALPKISEKNESKLLQNKLAKFTTQACILTGIFCLGLILFFVGWLIDTATVAWIGWQWWLLLLFVGLAAFIVSATVLVALYLGAMAAIDEDSEHAGAFRIHLSKRFSQSAFVGAGLSFLLTVIELAVSFRLNVAIFAVFLLLALVMLTAGLAVYHSALKRWGDDGAKIVNKSNGRLLRKIALFGLIPVGLAIVPVGVFSVWHPVTEEWCYENEDLAAFTAHMETFEWDGVEYVLPLSEIAQNAVDNVEYDLGNDFSCQFFNGLSVCDIYHGSIFLDDKGEVLFTIAQVYRISTADESFSVYNVSYQHDVIYGGNAVIDSYYALELRGSGAAYVSKIVNDYSGVSLGLVAFLVIVDIAVCTVIYFTKRKRIFIKL